MVPYVFCGRSSFATPGRSVHFQVQKIPLLDINELAAAKLAALLSRHTARDLFDAHLLLMQADLDETNFNRSS
jgi:predicted nucleotidyltransferase component of viral defense system